MYITCKCLNVSIRTRGNELKDVKDDDLEINPAERAAGFFNEKLATVTELEGITKEQSGLVEVRNVGSWIIHYCYNCSIYTHAVHREHGAALVLINTNMIMSSDEIDKMRASPNYSPVFRIVIVRNSLDDGDLLQPPTKFSVSQLSRPRQMALAGIQQQLEEAVQRQVAATEEKIRAFTAEQYQILEQFREKAHAEHTILTRLICNSEDTGKTTNNVEDRPNPTPERVKVNSTTSIAQSINSQSPNVLPGVITGENIRHQAAPKHPAHLQMNGGNKKKDKVQVFCQEPSSFNEEAMFSIEGMDDAFFPEQLQPSEDESETDGHDEGIHLPRGQRGGHPTLAKSLPVSVPAFPSFIERTIQDEDDDQLSRDPLDPHNIRASMKALAKSIHGDTVFGDLPRPRFSTQI
ncbi:uncharacterized protein PRAS40 [Venturia canescens]|uniref:uncharacterized protein PRAS40 n=1 Tax=Venturia canescens TaxID=32260 RepID=UPI001C9D45C8|nr:uncharacterized protein LOC122407209 [Venturia canescens]